MSQYYLYMNVQSVSTLLDVDASQTSEDAWWSYQSSESNILYRFNGQLCRLSWTQGYLPLPVQEVAALTQSNCHVLLHDEQEILNSITDEMDLYAQPPDEWCLWQNTFQAKLALEVYHMNFCEYCSSQLGMTSIARSLFDTYRTIGLTYSQFRNEFLLQCPCTQKNPS